MIDLFVGLFWENVQVPVPCDTWHTLLELVVNTIMSHILSGIDMLYTFMLYVAHTLYYSMYYNTYISWICKTTAVPSHGIDL